MANVQLTAGSGTYVATNTVSRDGQTENMELVNLADPTTAACVHIGSAGDMAVQIGGLNATATNLSGATSAAPLYVKASPGRVFRLINTATSSLAGSTIFIINQASGAAVAANVVYSCVGMAAGQIIDLQIPCTAGIGIYLSGTALANNIVLTWS